MSIVINNFTTAATNCVGVVTNGASYIDSVAKSGVKISSASEGGTEEGLYISAFALW